ncbi:NAD(P)-dependent alcohol dehydrogenase [Nonomuraea sp. NPDC050556]|uniref:NAD(P)-dependent alcohol dehydrogenase n=1 Tax=Nonomuraea sp. NPDC050556 TaxID=3364369 RepID=UPI003788C3E9
MKAFLLPSYGRLELADVPQPTPAAGEVLVRVRATSVQPYDWHFLRGEPRVARLMGGGLGLRRPGIDILGADVAGVVEAVGADVTGFAEGDEVYAMPKRGGFASHVCVAASEVVRKPRNLTFEQAAAVPMAAGTALLALDGTRPGHRVLVTGASGGVGTFAVQLAKTLGATVTAVCGTRNVAMVGSLGADEVIDYSAEDFTRLGRRFDLLVDIAGNRPLSACRRVLVRDGAFTIVGGPSGRWLRPVGRMVAALATAPLVPQRVTMADIVRCTTNRQNLTTLASFIEDGKVTPVIDRTYPFDEIPAALAYQETGHPSGKVVISVNGS